MKIKGVMLLTAGAVLAGAPMYQAPAAGVMEEITVTARKREESLASVPLAITAFTDRDFQKRNIESLSDVATFTPGFSYENYTGGITPAPVIRGLAQTALQSRIQNVGIFIDGIYIQQQGNIDFGLLGVERIEVVKGPQSALYGRNSFAGAINYVTRKPSEEFEGSIALTLGTDSREERRLTVSGPILPGLLYGRITTGRSEFDGTWKNNFRVSNEATGEVFADQAVSFRRSNGTSGNLGGYDNTADSASLLFTPTDTLTFDLNVYRFNLRRGEGAAGTLEPSANPDAIGQLNCNPNGNGINQKWCGELAYNPRDIARDPRNIGNYADSRIWNFGATLDISSQLTARYQYGRTNLSAYSIGAGDGSTPVQTTGTMSMSEAPVTELESDSHEIRLQFDSDRFTVLGGGFYMEIDDSNQQVAYNVQRLATGRNIQPVGGGPFAPNGVFEIRNDVFKDKMTSGFAAIDYRLTDTVTLGAEARYTREKKKIMDVRNPANDRQGTFSYFTPRVSIDWQFIEDGLIYGSIARGVKSGGFNAATADPGFEDYDEETNITYELGSKLRLMGGRMQLNTAVYYIDWDDLQIAFADTVPSDPDNPGLEPSFIGNASGASSIGLEVDGVLSITENLLANFAWSYTRAKFGSNVFEAGIGRTCNPDLCTLIELPVEGTELVNTVADISRNNLSRTPRNQLALGLEYNGVFGATGLVYTARGDVIYQDKMYAEQLNLATIENRTLANANLILADGDDRWSVSLWMKNVFDKEYISNAFVTGSPRRYITAFGDGRTAGVTATFNF